MNKQPEHTTSFLGMLARPEWVFALLATLVLIPLAMLTPAGANYDENMHVLRTDQICHGQIMPVFIGYAENYPQNNDQQKADAALYGGTSDKFLMLVTFNSNVNLQIDKGKYLFPTWRDPAAMADLLYGVKGTDTYAFTNTAINSPLVYLPYYPSLLVGEALQAPIYWIVVAMRLSGCLVYVICLWACIARIPFGKWMLAALALLPNQLATVSGVSADVVTNILCIVFVTQLVSFLALEGKPSRKDWIILGIASILLPLAKIVYFPFLLLLALVPLMNRQLADRRSWMLLSLFGVVGMALFAAWSSIIKGINPGAMWRPGISPSGQVASILAHPLRFIKSFVLSFTFPDIFQIESYGLYGGLGEINAPQYIIGDGWAAYLLLLTSINLRDARERMPMAIEERRLLFVAVFAGVAAICIGLIFVSVYLTYSSVGDIGFDGIQARYFIPVALLLQVALLVLFEQPVAEAQDKRTAQQRAIQVGLFVLLAVLLEFSLLVHMRFALFV